MSAACGRPRTPPQGSRYSAPILLGTTCTNIPRTLTRSQQRGWFRISRTLSLARSWQPAGDPPFVYVFRLMRCRQKIMGMKKMKLRTMMVVESSSLARHFFFESSAGTKTSSQRLIVGVLLPKQIPKDLRQLHNHTQASQRYVLSLRFNIATQQTHTRPEHQST